MKKKFLRRSVLPLFAVMSFIITGLFIASGVLTSGAVASEKSGNPEFKGKIAKKYKDSQEWWAPEVRPPKGAPNVIIFLLDDVGFAQVGSFGGLIETQTVISQLVDIGCLDKAAKTADLGKSHVIQ